MKTLKALYVAGITLTKACLLIINIATPTPNPTAAATAPKSSTTQPANATTRSCAVWKPDKHKVPYQEKCLV